MSLNPLLILYRNFPISSQTNHLSLHRLDIQIKFKLNGVWSLFIGGFETLNYHSDSTRPDCNLHMFLSLSYAIVNSSKVFIFQTQLLYCKFCSTTYLYWHDYMNMTNCLDGDPMSAGDHWLSEPEVSVRVGDQRLPEPEPLYTGLYCTLGQTWGSAHGTKLSLSLVLVIK